MQALPPPPASFLGKKTKILQQLAVPDSEYADASPKGSVDVGIRDLIAEINEFEGLVTTSSCAGRVSVFLEGRKHSEAGEDERLAQTTTAGVGGKGGGGAWLFVSHDPVTKGDETWMNSLELLYPEEAQKEASEFQGERRLIHFKFEPMILHVLSASAAHAQLILRCALQAGFRESGAVSLTPSATEQQPTPVVAIRSMGLSFESLIGYQIGDRRVSLVSPDYLQILMSIATERFAENTKRIERFLSAFRDAISTPPSVRRNPDGQEWEDAAERRERKRAEGLRRKAELEAEKAKQDTTPNEPDEANVDQMSSFLPDS
ncbi:unnamed protein product [Clonostachys rhizophaga]|uniref:tRNA(Phe) 7-[(3-amino-3-carboxypropyl)-4-demethylwyosine(37)-N(4)]-methyltransferase n=1 Tax=Clonostachys rhizophaga TaxID=160324 RepID=A0A9N9VF22_9HYPO|nr:unnamed protein product [Clonostachys rhizophaga]